jgi:phage-related protein
MDLTIIRSNGAVYSLAELGIKTLNFEVDSPEPIVVSEEMPGRNGRVDVGAWYGSRSMRGSFFVQAHDTADFPLLRNEMFRAFASREPFHLIDSREPGKRWYVRASGRFAVQQIRQNKGKFDVEFSAESTFAESIGTTADPLTFDAELWQLGQGLTADDVSYTHNTAQFQIYNAGDVTVDPRELPLKITFTGASTNLRIRNLTTGGDWQYTGTTNAGQSIILDGVRATKSGLSIFGATNRKLLTVAPGLNDFEITGATGAFAVAFDFRFYYV